VIYEITWQNVADQHRPEMTISRLRFACWISKTTDKLLRICDTDFPRNCSYAKMPFCDMRTLPVLRLVPPLLPVFLSISSSFSHLYFHLLLITIILLSSFAFVFCMLLFTCSFLCSVICSGLVIVTPLYLGRSGGEFLNPYSSVLQC
jgi:hypothetical protein